MNLNAYDAHADSASVTPMISRLRARTADRESGVSMIEVIFALLIVAVGASVGATLLISSIRGVNNQKVKQNAAYVADQEMEQIQALPVQPTNELIYGRTQSAVNAINTSAAATRLKIASQDDLSNAGDYDSAAGDSPANIPTTLSRTLDSVTYHLTNFINICWMNTKTGACGTTNAGSYDKEYRASVDVYWTSAVPCANGCNYSTSTIIDPTADPTFNTNISNFSISLAPGTTDGSVHSYNGADTCTIGSNSYAKSGEVVTASTNPTNALQNGATVQIATGGGTISNLTLVDGSDVSFCVSTLDTPGSYTVSVINPDGSHGQAPLIEVAQIASVQYSASGTDCSGQPELTLYGGGFETGGTVSVTTNPSSMTIGSQTVTPQYPSAADEAILCNVGGLPANGQKDTLTLTNPDTSTATFSVTAPTVSTLSVNGVANTSTTSNVSTDALTGTGFESGMTATQTGGTGTCTAISVSGVSANGKSATLTYTGGASGTTCQFTLRNPDGGTTSGSSGTITATMLPPPTIASTSPTFITAGQSNQSITLTGTGFQSGMTVSVTPSSVCSVASITSVSGSTSAVLKITGGAVGSCTVTLTSTSGVSGPAYVIAVQGPPAPSPTSYSELVGSSLTISGTNFQSGMTATVSNGTGTGCTPTHPAVTVSSSTSATLTLSGGTGGKTCTFTLTNTTGGTSGNVTVTMDNKPQVSGGTFVVVAGNSTQLTLGGGGTNGTASGLQGGTGFADATTASVSPSSVCTSSNWSYSTTTSATLKITGVAAGTCTVTLSNNSNDGAQSTFTVTINAAPNVTNLTVSPTSNCHSTTCTWTVTGSGFEPGSGTNGIGTGAPTVTLTEQGGGTITVTLTKVTATQIVFTSTKPTSTGNKSFTVTVTNADGGSDNLTKNVSV